MPANLPLAIELFKRAAGAGQQSAQQWLAECYSRGHGVPKDNSLAFTWSWLALNGKHDMEEDGTTNCASAINISLRTLLTDEEREKAIQLGKELSVKIEESRGKIPGDY